MFDEDKKRVKLYQNTMKDISTPNVEYDLIKRGFFAAPASTKFHGNYRGGLFDHSLSVTIHLVNMTEKYNLIWQKKRSPYLVGMFHDLCKIDQYLPVMGGFDENTNTKVFSNKCVGYEYNKDCLLKGHGEKSVMLLSQYYKLTEEEIMCIRYHMGAFTDKEEWKDYTRAVKFYPNVLWTHTADMLASHV